MVNGEDPFLTEYSISSSFLYIVRSLSIVNNFACLVKRVSCHPASPSGITLSRSWINCRTRRTIMAKIISGASGGTTRIVAPGAMPSNIWKMTDEILNKVTVALGKFFSTVAPTSFSSQRMMSAELLLMIADSDSISFSFLPSLPNKFSIKITVSLSKRECDSRGTRLFL